MEIRGTHYFWYVSKKETIILSAEIITILNNCLVRRYRKRFHGSVGLFDMLIIR